MSTEWIMSLRDTEIAADIEREIERIGRDDGRSGNLRINYATGLVIEDAGPVAEASEVVQQATASANS
jgi:hypothetical protein